ncbi:hypothetical protein IC617_18690 [Neiella sp. HB171785]|uniref:Uncharacterized protein n=1 Tax=Neiella litorisoli TaxID=2771431 RepID=A0A8J6UQJ8_9GAMM|nr:hypothetical protein [Neiella litorisoli]
MFFASKVAADCSFEKQRDLYHPALAEQDASESFQKNDVHFIAVANGFAPTRPGFKNIKPTRCLFLESNWTMLWVGADSNRCNDHSELNEQALNYAARFNKKMLELASESDSYICKSDLLGNVP